MNFLYGGVLGISPKKTRSSTKNKVVKKDTKDREVDFEKLQKVWKERGLQSEKYALEFEKARLRSTGLKHCISKITDCTKKPRFGYDFRSFSAEGVPRYIEVKTFTQDRFFLSANELKVSKSNEHAGEYYFYLVKYDSSKQPFEVETRKASTIYPDAEMTAQNYLVTLS